MAHTVTSAQREALNAFAHKHGLRWKEKLCHVWMTGQTQYEENATELLQVKKQFGPEWLKGYSARYGS